MNRLTQLLALCGVTAVVMASCGGGSTPSSTLSASNAPAQHAQNTVPMQPASSRTVVGRTTLTLKLAPTVQARNGTLLKGRNASAAALARKTTGAKRSPSYVGPVGQCDECQNVLDIFVDGTLVPNVEDGSPSSDTMLVTPSANGTVTAANVPLYSTSNNDIVVVEFAYNYNDDSKYNAIIAVGETWYGNYTAGSSNTPTVTMQMNAYNVGILDIYYQADPELLTGQQYYGIAVCPSTGSETQFGLYDADWTGQFVASAGYGGTTNPTITSSTSDNSGTTTIQQSTIAGLYQVGWDANCDGVTINASATNPVAALYNDATNSYAPNGSSGYYNCYFGYGTCPGGPYQGLWNLQNETDRETLPPQYNDQPPTSSYWMPDNNAVSGQLDIQATPSPGPSGD